MQNRNNGQIRPETAFGYDLGVDAGIIAPLFVTSTQNLGHARCEGLELALQRGPATGFGYTASSAILPNANFQPGGTGFDGFTGGRVPYAQGYAELNHRSATGTRSAFGATYYGPNNQFNRPAFAVVSANARGCTARRRGRRDRSTARTSAPPASA